MSNKVQIQTQVHIASGATEVRRLQAQLDQLAKQLKLNIKDINILGNQTSSAGNSASQAMSKATQEASNYEKAIGKLLQTYKMKKIADEDMIKITERMMNYSKFKELSDQKQLQILNAKTKAENNYTSTLKTQQSVMNSLHTEALKVNTELDRQKQKEVETYRKAEEKKTKELQQEVNKRQRIEQEYSNWWNRQLIQQQQRTQQRVNSLNSNAPSSSVRVYDALQQSATQTSMQGRLQTLQNSFGTMQRNSSFSGIVNPQQLSAINTQFTQLQQNISSISNNRMAQQWNTQFSQLSNTLRGINTQLPQTANYFQNLVMIGKKFLDWIVIGNVIMGVSRAIQDSVKYVVEMDNALVNLSKVVDLSKNQLDDLRQSAIQLGKELGKSSADIMRAYAEIGRVYKNPEDIKEFSRVAVMASNVTSLTAEQAAKALNTTLLTFKLGVNDAKTVLDQFNELQNNYRVSAEDLAGSIEKVGAAAKQAGISIQELEGYTTALVSSTGMSGDESGTALKSIISRTFRIGAEGEEDAGKTEETLNSLGIAVRKNETEFRDFGNILEDIKTKWDGWTNVTKQNVAQVIAG